MRITPNRKILKTLSPFLIGGASAVGTSVVAPVVRRLMVRSGILDNPNERSSHTDAIPRGGGWACLLGTVSGCVTGRALGYHIPWKTAAGAVTLALVGFADDRWSVSALPRLAAQVSIGLAADASAKHFPLGVVGVPTLVNVVNFMDGINGITALTTTAWGAGAAAVGIRTDNDHIVLLGASLAGAALGFLPHNLRREKMFLGDIGSYLIGATMALTAMHPSLSWHARAAVLAPLLPYVVDTGMTLARRAARGDSVITAHREHIYQKLANDRGLGHVRVAFLYAVFAAMVSALAVLSLPRSHQ